MSLPTPHCPRGDSWAPAVTLARSSARVVTRVCREWNGVASETAGEIALRRPDVACRRSEQPARSLLLEDVRRPAGHPGAREHRGRQRRWDLGDVENDRRVVLDVRRKDAVRRLLLQRLQRDALELL